MNTRHLALIIKDAIANCPDLEWVNTDQGYWERKDGHVYIGADGLIDCTLIAEAILSPGEDAA